jgi:hypothetical protein
MVSQITPEEFRWQDANYDRDCALGRELLFLIADNGWCRATAEKVAVTRSDTIETRIEVDIDFAPNTHEAFCGRTGHIWLPILILPPLRQGPPEPDPVGALLVTDATGTPVPTLPDADVTHRIAAAITQIIVNMAVPRLPDAGDGNMSLGRERRLVLSAAVYRLLRGDHVPSAVMSRQSPPRQPATGPVYGLARAREEVGDLLEYFSRLLTRPDGDADGARRLTERAIRVLLALAESTVVVVAAEVNRPPAVLTVAVPSRPLHLTPPGFVQQDGATVRIAHWWRHPGTWRWLHPGRWNWILPRACLQIDVLLPSAEADRQVQVSLPEGVALDPSRSRMARAELDIRTKQPQPIRQLGELVLQLVRYAAWPTPLYQSLADLSRAKASAALQSLREHQVGALLGRPALTASESMIATRNFRGGLEEVHTILGDIAAKGQTTANTARLAKWQQGSDWLSQPMQRRVTTEAVSPDVVAARARLIEDASQRATPTRARIRVYIAVTDSEHFSIARFSGWMSALLMTVVLGFFAAEKGLGISSQQVSPEVLAIVLTLFSAIQAGRIERPDRSTVRGLLAQAGSGLIVASIMPAVILAVALAFSRSSAWVIIWAAVSISLQLLLQGLLRQRLRKELTSERQGTGDPATSPGPTLYTDTPDYSHAEVLHSDWWRSTTAEALTVGRHAYAYLAWQHGGPQTLSALLEGWRPAVQSRDALRAQMIRFAGRRRSRRPHDATALPDGGPPADGRTPPSVPDHRSDDAASSGERAEGLHASLLEQPANVLALQRSSTAAQSLTFAVFRDEPQEDWEPAPKDMIKVELDPSRLAPAENANATVRVFVGLRRGEGLLTVTEHPLAKILQASAERRLPVLEAQLPVPPPDASYADLLWAQVKIGLHDGDIDRLTGVLQDLMQLATQPDKDAGPGEPPMPIIGVQAVSEGILRILNPRPAAANPSPAHSGHGGRGRLVLARDLDVVAASGLDRTERPSARTWRVMAIGADWRTGIESTVLSRLDPSLELAGLTLVKLFGKAVMLLLGHRPDGPGGHDQPQLMPPGGDGRISLYLDEEQSRTDLGAAGEYPLIRVHMRTPDRPGATLEILESLRITLKEMAPRSLGEDGWNVRYARAVLSSGNVATIQLTAQLAVDPETTPPAGKPVSRWGPAEFSMIEQRALALAAHKTSATSDRPVNDKDLPENTMISVDLVKTPDLDPAAPPTNPPLTGS